MGAARSVRFDLRLVRSRLLDILDLEDQLVNVDTVLDEVAAVRNLVEAMIRAHEAQELHPTGSASSEEAVGS